MKRSLAIPVLVAAFTWGAGALGAAGLKPPIVIVPGAPGTELVDAKTGERVWPNAKLMSIRGGTDRLALPLDDPEGGTIIAGELLRDVHVGGMKFHVKAYDGLEAKLHELGYRAGDWNAPKGGAEYFYYPYDWRQSVDTSGRRFARDLAALYRRSPEHTPPAIVLGHSLGGLVARYALMYGDAPLGDVGALPSVDWSGSAQIGTLFLVATPNEGTFLALKRLQNGIFYRAHRGAFSAETLFSYPSVFDMIPEHLPPLLDRDGNPLPFNLDDPDDWERLGWSVVDPRKESAIPYAARRAHLTRELARTRRLWAAMNQLAARPNPVSVYVVACVSRTVQRTALVTPGSSGMKVSFDPPAVSRTRFKALLFEPGDEMVPMRSLVAEDSTHDPAGSLYFTRVLRSTKSHHHLLSSPELLSALDELLK
jgi:pimeloyl-ACP methyl ester carboxylesterase